MHTSKKYSRAPIIEAIIDLRVTLPGEFPVDKLADLHALIDDRFPTKEFLHTSAVMIQAGPTMKIDTSQQHSGFLFRSEDKRRVFQASLGGFAFNQLAPYESWESFRNEAKELWQIYKGICKPLAITRVATRFINRLELPGPSVDFNDYLRTTPQIAPNLPQGLSGFFMQLQIPQEDLHCMLLINEALVSPSSPETISVILDFDLFGQQDWQIEEDEEVWAFLEQLRDRKNLAFEASITDKTRGLFSDATDSST